MKKYSFQDAGLYKYIMTSNQLKLNLILKKQQMSPEN